MTRHRPVATRALRGHRGSVRVSSIASPKPSPQPAKTPGHCAAHTRPNPDTIRCMACGPPGSGQALAAVAPVLVGEAVDESLGLY